MKKLIAMLMIFTMIFIVTACENENTVGDNKTDYEENLSNEPEIYVNPYEQPVDLNADVVYEHEKAYEAFKKANKLEIGQRVTADEINDYKKMSYTNNLTYQMLSQSRAWTVIITPPIGAYTDWMYELDFIDHNEINKDLERKSFYATENMPKDIYGYSKELQNFTVTDNSDNKFYLQIQRAFYNYLLNEFEKTINIIEPDEPHTLKLQFLLSNFNNVYDLAPRMLSINDYNELIDKFSEEQKIEFDKTYRYTTYDLLIEDRLYNTIDGKSVTQEEAFTDALKYAQIFRDLSKIEGFYRRTSAMTLDPLAYLLESIQFTQEDCRRIDLKNIGKFEDYEDVVMMLGEMTIYYDVESNYEKYPEFTLDLTPIYPLDREFTLVTDNLEYYKK